MASTTPRLGLPRPVGSEQADGPDAFNDLTEALDPQIAIFAGGTQAARPAPGTAGRFYWNTTIKAMEYDDGAQWNPIGPVEPPVGSVQMWGGTAAPAATLNGVARWLLCQGQTTVPAATYPELASVLGTTGTNVNMPDLRGRHPVGAGTAAGSSGADPHVRGDKGGLEKVLLGVNEMPVHRHVLNDPRHTHGHGSPPIESASGGVGEGWGTRFLARTGYDGGYYQGYYNELAYTGITMNDAGGNIAHTNMSPFYCLNFIIRAL